MHPDTIAVHGGQREHGQFGFPVPQLVLNSAVLLDSSQHGLDMFNNPELDNIAYQRYSNPTIKMLEEKFALMEGARFSLAVNSGMTACYLLFRALLKTGEHILAQHSLYHEISDQMKYDVESCGVACSFIEDYSIESFDRAIQENTRLVFIESPTNPVMYDVDIPELARLCRRRGVPLVVDNTFLTHEYQKPLDLGADLTLYSTTKSINGHGDAMGALISTNDPELYQRLKQLRDNTGMIIDPFSAWLTIRGLRTLRLRLDRHTSNAKAVVSFLHEHYPQYKTIYPTALPYSARNQVADGGGVVSVVLDSKEQGTAFINSLSLFKIGTTFGNLESLCYHFGTFAYQWRDITKIGIPLGLVRLSVGIENIDDILADIDQALKASEAAVRP